MRFRSNFNQVKWDAAVREHQEMIDALTARAAGSLRRILERHLLHKRDTVLEQFDAAVNAAAEATGKPTGNATGRAVAGHPA